MNTFHSLDDLPVLTEIVEDDASHPAPLNEAQVLQQLELQVETLVQQKMERIMDEIKMELPELIRRAIQGR